MTVTSSCYIRVTCRSYDLSVRIRGEGTVAYGTGARGNLEAEEGCQRPVECHLLRRTDAWETVDRVWVIDVCAGGVRNLEFGTNGFGL